MYIYVLYLYIIFIYYYIMFGFMISLITCQIFYHDTFNKISSFKQSFQIKIVLLLIGFSYALKIIFDYFFYYILSF